MNILAIIPARGGSKGIPQKNIKKLYKRPLIEYSINAAKSSKKINKIIVSTDNEKIAKKILDAFEREFPDDQDFFKPEIMHIQPIIPFKAIAENAVITKLKDAVGGTAKRELKKELDEIRGTVNNAKKTIKADIEGKKQREDEIADLKGKGLVSLKGDLMNELRKRTELMEVLTEVPPLEESTESSKDDSKDKQS